MAVAVATEEKTVPKRKQKSYFVKSVNRFYLDDEESFIEHKLLDEGLFQQYQDLTSKIKLDRTGENTELDIRPGVQRKFLLEKLVTGWNMLDDNSNPLPYSPIRLQELPPVIIRDLIEDIYKQNPVLGSEDDSDAEGKDKTK